MTLAADVEQQLGRAWDQDAWSCWDLVRHMQRHFGRDLPVVPGSLAESRAGLVRAFAGHAERANWQQGQAEHGSIALMARNDGGRDAEVHAGIHLVFERPFVLHVDKPHGTVLDTVPMLRVRGWQTINFYGPV